MNISESLARRLVLLRRHLWLSHPPVVDGGALDSAVAYLGHDVPDDVLAYLAALGISLATALEGEGEIESFYEAQEERDWRKHAHYDHVPFDAWGDWPRMYAMFERTSDAIGVLNIKTMTIDRFASMGHYIDWRWGDQVNFDEAVDIADFKPAITRAPPKGARRVVHVKFGTGTVLAEAEGKLQIDFGEHGIKTIAEKFVSPSE